MATLRTLGAVRSAAVSLPCHTCFHFAPASTAPGMAVMLTSLGGGGCAKPFCCATDGMRERAPNSGSCLVEDMLMLYRLIPSRCVILIPGEVSNRRRAEGRA